MGLLMCFLAFKCFILIDLLIFSYIFLSGNWYGKWTAIDIYLASWIGNLSVLLESSHWFLCHPLGLLTWFFFKTLIYEISWNFECEGVLPELWIDIDVFFYEYFTDVLCAAFYKILIKYFENKKLLLSLLLSLLLLLPPQGFRSEGEIPRRHFSNSRVH